MNFKQTILDKNIVQVEYQHIEIPKSKLKAI